MQKIIKCTGLNKYMGDNFNGWAKWYFLKLLDSSFEGPPSGGFWHHRLVYIPNVHNWYGIRNSLVSLVVSALSHGWEGHHPCICILYGTYYKCKTQQLYIVGHYPHPELSSLYLLNGKYQQLLTLLLTSNHCTMVQLWDHVIIIGWPLWRYSKDYLASPAPWPTLCPTVMRRGVILREEWPKEPHFKKKKTTPQYGNIWKIRRYTIRMQGGKFFGLFWLVLDKALKCISI